MNNMTLYAERNSPVHRVDPLTKLLFVFISIASTYLVSNHLVVLVILLCTFIILFTGKVFKSILPVIGVSFLLIASIIIVQGFFHPDRATVLVRDWSNCHLQRRLFYRLAHHAPCRQYGCRFRGAHFDDQTG